jgi:hypothetical protein
MQCRDSTSADELASDAVIDRWSRVIEIIEGLEDVSGETPFTIGDALAATGATIVRRAVASYQVDAGVLHTAANILLQVAESVTMPLNPVREMKWDLGADRSAASSLPFLLDESLCEAAGIRTSDVHTALLQLAGSPYEEVRLRLAAGLQRELADAPHGERAHGLALSVIEELVATSGFGPWTPEGFRPHTRLPEPIESTLETDELVLNVGYAGDAIPGLVAASSGTCEHAAAARNLLLGLAEYDRRVWPKHFARFNYVGLGRWRSEIDAYVAERALSGIADDLWAHLDAFAHVAEDIRGVLSRLSAGATTPERAIIVHDLWPTLMDRLLPASRDLRLPEDTGGAWHARDRQEPHSTDVEELDRALLLSPPEGLACSWPWDRTSALVIRWVDALRSQPHVADRLIDVLIRLGWLRSPAATQMILTVLGNDVEAIERGCRMVTAWLRLVLLQAPEAVQDKLPVRTLLDRLAVSGNEDALALQQQLES